MSSNMDMLLFMIRMMQQQQQQQQQQLEQQQQQLSHNFQQQFLNQLSNFADPFANSNFANLQDYSLKTENAIFGKLNNNHNLFGFNNFVTSPAMLYNNVFSSTVTSTPTSSFDDQETKFNISPPSSATICTHQFPTPSSIISESKSSATDTDFGVSPYKISTPKKSPTEHSKNSSTSISHTSFDTSSADDNVISSFESTKDQNEEEYKISIPAQQMFASTTTDILIQEENLKNLEKFSSSMSCPYEGCKTESLREHFHCSEIPCKGKTLNKKEDIIRHLKWHKKRKESEKFGFLRFSSSDDCTNSSKVNCPYRWKQTHYHCKEQNCEKVYVSTSDVQMHSNFHRKNAEIIQEGFQRFRAIENCKTGYCPFTGKNISHYHCCRDDCKHTFKHKSDMDKHKSYHLKDVQLALDGFKKILKSEVCPFENCKFSTVTNHIHCIRENCNHVLHSSSQLISHKRKHDKEDDFILKPDNNSECTITPKSNINFTSEPKTPSTPVTSNTSASQFLSRKRGRPSKKIHSETLKKQKLESPYRENMTEQNANPIIPQIEPNITGLSLPLSPNLQLTHLMALFQPQNANFYHNLPVCLEQKKPYSDSS